MNELRKDYALDRWVLIAHNRAKRPHELKKKKEQEKSPVSICVFCPGSEHLTPPEIARLPDGKGSWLMRSFPNKFPALAHDFYGAYGAHEVIVETTVHDVKFAELPEEQIAKSLDFYSARLSELRKDKKLSYSLLFKNEGAAAGISLVHTHSQLISLRSIPPLVRDEISAYSAKKCVFCSVIKKEMRSERRIYEDEHTAVFAPYASRFPFEAWFAMKRHIGSLTDATAEEKRSLARALKKILKALDDIAGADYNLFFHISPFKGKELHFHIELCPRISLWAGFEFGSEIIINTMPPELAAEAYRHALW